MVSEELSHLFENLSRELTKEMRDEVNFLIDDYLDVFGISDAVRERQMFDELHRHLGTRRLIKLLSDVFSIIDQRDLCALVSRYASLFPAEDVVRPEESSPDGSSANADAAADSTLCQLPSVQTDADSTETLANVSAGDSSESVSMHDISESLLQRELRASLDISGIRTGDIDVISPLRTLMESPQHSSNGYSPPADSGFSSGSASTTSPSSIASLNLLHSKSSSTVDMELDFPVEVKIGEMKTYIDYTSKIGKGGFGTVYKGEYKRKHVAIKTGRHVEDSERQFLKEKQLAFLRNTFIVPILAYTIEKESLMTLFAHRYVVVTLSEMLMIMYPYMDNSDLTNVCERLDRNGRLRVFYHCSEGLAFLHRTVPGVRNEIIHGDIKPGNILLDANFNARLGDVGVAAELPKDATHCTNTANIFYGTEGYEDPYNSRPDGNAKIVRRKENDIFSLGVVGLQFLKWQQAVLFETDEDGLSEKLLLRTKLKKIKPRTAQQLLSSDEFFDKNIWHHEEHEQGSKTNEDVAELVLACLELPTKRVTSEDLACKLKELLMTNKIPRYKTMGNSCQYCCVKEADPNPTLIPCSDTCRETCEFKRLCQSCHQTAYRNPLYCPEHGRLKQFIRPEECFAILISGFDGVPEDQQVFDDDVQNMFNIITDPRVMGFSKNNVFRISIGVVEKRKEIRNVLQRLKEKTVEMLIVYYSGHGTEESEGDPELWISENDVDMKAQELKELLDSVKCTRLLVILDCCFAGRYKVVVDKPGGPIGWRIQLNGTGAEKEGNLTENSFTRHLICAVNGFHVCPGADDDENAPPCRMCVKFKKLSETRGYIDVYDFIGFCSEHVKLSETKEDCPDSNMSAGGLLHGKAELAPFKSKPFAYIFRYQNKDDESEKFHLWNLKQNPDDILHELWNKIDACCSLPKHTDYRCLKMQGLVRAKEKEIRARDELILQFNRGCIVQVCIRSNGSDLDKGKNVVVFCSQHDKFIEMLKCLAKDVYAAWFQEEEPLKVIEAEYSCIIKCGETDDIRNKVAEIWNYSSYDEKKNFSSVLSDSLNRANTISREQVNAGHPPISGLRIDVTKEFALLSIV